MWKKYESELKNTMASIILPHFESTLAKPKVQTSQQEAKMVNNQQIQ